MVWHAKHTGPRHGCKCLLWSTHLSEDLCVIGIIQLSQPVYISVFEYLFHNLEYGFMAQCTANT